MPSKTKKNNTERSMHSLWIVSSAAIVLAIISMFVAVSAVMYAAQQKTVQATTSVVQPNFGSTLAGIDTPLNSTDLAVINNASDVYFQTAGEMYLNGSLSDPIFTSNNKVAPFMVNGKPSVIYLGSITCIFCGENRWAMALALSKFGKFSQLFTGYSSFGDGDVPTLYWAADNYNSSGDSVKNYYSSSYVNFVSIEDINPIRGGFLLNSPSKIIQDLNATENKSAIGAFNYIINLSAVKATAFMGTPYTIWGTHQFSGADAEVFGNTTPSGSVIDLTYMTHAQVFSQLSQPQDQFAWSEYAAADIYIASLCQSLNNTVQVCSLPAIRSIEARIA
ncbi:MAG: DUF929 family protein [Candidatus Marsarchaeota archaeon]|nr:DUF929 family protein [Candidatus Marsarchaeota archaeon]MCL5413558.1 DUF929 family protein [Candidatus Marsarchaeota archaeon]